MIELRVKKRFGSGGFTLDLTLTADDGITVLAGASGAGKSTLLHCLTGLVRPDAGRIVIHGRPLFDSDCRIDVAAHRRRIGLVFQDLALFPHLSVAQNIAFGLRHLSRKERAQRTDQGVTLMRIAGLAHRPVRMVSGGERQRVALARSLVTHPEVLLLDEALSSLDRPTKYAIVADLRAWNREIGTPLIHVTHDPEEAAQMSDRAVVLTEGRICRDGRPADVMDDGRELLVQATDSCDRGKLS